MAAASVRRTLLSLSLIATVCAAAHAQAVAPAPSGATPAWTIKTKGEIRWQQVTPSISSAGRSATLASKRFRASLTVPGSVFMLTPAPEGKGNVLLEVAKDSAQPRARVDLGKEREPVYAVDDVAGMLFLQIAPGTLVGYRL